MKRVIAISDMHCGHYGGLTPPRFQIQQARRPKLFQLQLEGWLKFEAMREEATNTKNEIILLDNGDNIDGNRFPHEQIVSDRREQCVMAEEVLNGFRAKHIVMTRGTPSHVGKEEDWEDNIAKDVGADIRSEQFIDVDGYKIYMRHKIGRSSVAHGKDSAPAKHTIWNQLKSAWKLEPGADMLLFGHVHYCHGSFDYFGNRKVDSMTLPALQTVSQYGIKECTGIVHFGMVYFDVEDGVKSNQHELIEVIQSAKPKEIIIS